MRGHARSRIIEGGRHATDMCKVCAWPLEVSSCSSPNGSCAVGRACVLRAHNLAQTARGRSHAALLQGRASLWSSKGQSRRGVLQCRMCRCRALAVLGRGPFSLPDACRLAAVALHVEMRASYAEGRRACSIWDGCTTCTGGCTSRRRAEWPLHEGREEGCDGAPLDAAAGGQAVQGRRVGSTGHAHST